MSIIELNNNTDKLFAVPKNGSKFVLTYKLS